MEELRVTPARLRDVAARQSEIGSFMTGLAVGTELSSAGAGLPGLASSAACDFAGSVIDQFHSAVGDELSDHSDKLNIAADRYANTDAELGRRLATYVR
jgi:Excreted virulence factor EspC, type VII ESX diderm